MRKVIMAGVIVLAMGAGIFIGSQTSMISEASSGQTSAAHWEMHKEHSFANNTNINKVKQNVWTEQKRRAQQAQDIKEEQTVKTTNAVCGICGRDKSICGGNCQDQSRQHTYRNSGDRQTHHNYDNTGNNRHHSENRSGHHGGRHH